MYPSARSREEAVPVHSGAHEGEQQSRHPYGDDGNYEPPVGHTVPSDDAHPGVDRNGENEETTRHVPNMQKPRLEKASWRRRQNLAQGQPVEGYRKGDGLLQVGEQKHVYQYYVLVVADVLLVVLPP
jgi:hypothetical protein